MWPMYEFMYFFNHHKQIFWMGEDLVNCVEAIFGKDAN